MGSSGLLCSASGGMLRVNPEERLSITEVVRQLQEMAAARNLNPKAPITEVRVSCRCSVCSPRPWWAGTCCAGWTPLPQPGFRPVTAQVLALGPWCSAQLGPQGHSIRTAWWFLPRFS